MRQFLEKAAIFLGCALDPFAAISQSGTVGNKYPEDYFRNPLDIPIFLAGNFGECRPGHFHSGIDIKTKGEENQPVRAAAAGYISRIKMESGGFGHGVYITHPNGYTTLYAHLNDFAPEIQKYVRAKQYEQERWNVDLQLPPGQFPLKKGQLIAYSGNTGASTAPHLHFEIRNTKTEHPLNPEQFGLPIIDHMPTVPAELALYPGNVFVDARDQPIILSLKKVGEHYKPVKSSSPDYSINKDTVTVPSGSIGLGINADDYMNGSDNTITFYVAKLFMDDNLQSEVVLDDIGYDETRYINAYTDYRGRKIYHKWIQLLFKLPGNNLGHLFPELNSDFGRLKLDDGKVHKVRLELYDDKWNKSVVEFYAKPGAKYEWTEHLDTEHFSWNKINAVKKFNIEFTLDARQLYDDIDFLLIENSDANAYSHRFYLHTPFVPLHHYFELSLKPTRPIPFDLRSKMVMLHDEMEGTEGKAASAGEGGWYKAQERNFGAYWLQIDTTVPNIKTTLKDGANLAKASQISFTATDDMTSVKSFNGYIDNQWVCFEQHASTYFYKFDEHCPKGKHELVFKAQDENGNERIFKTTFTR